MRATKKRLGRRPARGEGGVVGVLEPAESPPPPSPPPGLHQFCSYQQQQHQLPAHEANQIAANPILLSRNDGRALCPCHLRVTYMLYYTFKTTATKSLAQPSHRNSANAVIAITPTSTHSTFCLSTPIDALVTFGASEQFHGRGGAIAHLR